MTQRHTVVLAARASLIAVALSLCVAVQPSSAQGGRPYTVGEQQPAVDIGRGSLAIYPEEVGQNLRQTFSPRANQWLGYLQLPVGCTENALLRVRIREGFEGTILYEVNIIGLPTVVDGSFSLIQVFDPAVSRHGLKLKKGQEYAIELAAFPGPGTGEVACGLASGPYGDSYTRGNGYYRDPPTNGWDFLPLSTPAGEDIPFMTLVR
jgi:hypothetical protein